VRDRDGAIEIAVAPEEATTNTSLGANDVRAGDLVWRVRLLRVTDDELRIESPRALGREVHMAPGTEIVAGVVIGQNRWTFRSRVVAETVCGRSDRMGGGSSAVATVGSGTLRLEAPAQLERCRRLHGRIDAAALCLPAIELWPLLDPSSVVAAHRVAERLVAEAIAGRPVDCGPLFAVQPTVGPSFGATLMNIGGGGIGVRVEPSVAPVLARHPVLWVSIPLGAGMPVPAMATVKVVHTHIDSAQMTYAGLCFDFSFVPSAQRVITDQIETAIRHRLERHPLRAA